MEYTRKYYWLRLKEGFFDSKHIKFLRSQKDGDRMTIVYLQLQLKSLKTVGVINYDRLLPSCAEEIAFDLGEPVELVSRTIKALEMLNLVEVMDDGSLYLNAVQDLVGSETAAAERKRRERERNRQPDTGQSSPGGNPFEEWSLKSESV